MRLSILLRTLLSFLALSISINTHAQERIALVIGNANYQTSPLDNSVNDAQDIASTLKELDFKVTLVTDGNKQTMESAIVKFGDKLNKDTVGLFYYSGHAVQYKGSNYLVPIGSVGQVNKVEDLPSSTVAANLILNKLEGSLSKLNFVFLDSCRDNPFANLGNQITPGLAKTEGGSDSGALGLPSLAKGMFTSRGITKERVKLKKDTTGTLVAYSTMPGKVASDGSGRNSPYTKHLLERIKEPNALVQIMLSDVMSAVEKETDGQQTPIYEAAISGRFCFKSVNNQCGKTINIYSSFLEGVEDVQSLELENEAGRSKYLGQVNERKSDGKGVLVFENGNKYEGEFKDGTPYGKGVAYFPSGDRYDGEWKDYRLHGKGIYTWTNGDRYEGEFKNDQIDGNGVFNWSNGDRYEGRSKNNKEHGKGILALTSGYRYEGEYKNGVYHGNGIEILSNGQRYEGEFRNGKPHGVRNIFTGANGDRYEGGYKDGMQHGKGILIRSNGFRYEGEFKDDKPYHTNSQRNKYKWKNKQKTIEKVVKARGIGMYSGKIVNMTLLPAPSNHGIVFKNKDVGGINRNTFIHEFGYTSIKTQGVKKATTYVLLMQALSKLGIDNMLIEMDSFELPIDGSTDPFVFLIRSAGIVTSNIYQYSYESRWTKIQKNMSLLIQNNPNIRQLERNTKDSPKDAESWALLGYSYISIGKNKAGVAAYSKARELEPTNVSWLIESASILAQLQNDQYRGEPIKLINQALKLDPNNVEALWRLGLYQYQQNTINLAIATWEQTLPLMPSQSKAKIALMKTLVMVKEKHSVKTQKDKTVKLTVNIDIDPSIIQNRLRSNDFIMIYVRTANGMPIPIAIEKMRLKDFSGKVTLSDNNSVMPSRLLSQADKIIAVARITKTGQAIKQAGDIEVRSQPFSLKETVKVNLNINSEGKSMVDKITLISNEPWPADQAFAFSVSATDANTLLARWNIYKGYYLFNDKFFFEVKDAEFGNIVFPEGEIKDDPLLGKFEIHKGELNVVVPLKNIQAKKITFTAKYQGCWLDGICYPLIEKSTNIVLPNQNKIKK